ncbi:membrane fusion protein (multidrug efflux system) [Povalibacter uvarum]|uniref:Membrane fusion protein (Multidrug efflux system) n=1 Tax=Povalibacter uvarum TaxID=732238 RepID=A0A841HPN9_9GAMM|nr:efflux RND transporter periplasmic adaptor subunit [Povalibacter uvarum]MBB6094604.1 membrane fusion protein (multidrug efflux system) [Povalibacter uvarum]
MVSSVRNIVVGAALLVAVAGIGWYAVSNGDAPAAKPAAGARPGFGPGGPVGVLVATVGYEPFAQGMEAIGTARANEAVDITAKVSNRVTAIAFREGQQVRTGDVLVEFDSEQARANLAEAEAALRDSRSQFNRSRELFATKALSEAQLDQLQATLSMNEARVAGARSQLNDTIIRAPFAGRVGLRNVSIGSFVSPTTVITTLDDTSVIKLDFSVPEVFLADVREGLEITGRTTAYSDEVFKGKVTSIDSRLDPVSRAVTVRARIDNRDGRLKPGMLMTVNLQRVDAPTLLIPEQALVPEGDRKFVFTVRDEKAVRTEVHTGRRRPGEVEVLKGLIEGDVVVVEGTQKVRDGLAVKPTTSSEAVQGAAIEPKLRRDRA